MNLSDEKYQGLKDAKIMIVDDEPINIDAVQAFLEDEKYCNFSKKVLDRVFLWNLKNHNAPVVIHMITIKAPDSVL